MADEITRCEKILDESDNVVQYDFSYSVENAGKINTFCVTIKASEMTDATSSSEAKTKANVKAAAIKSAWVAQEQTSAEAVASVVGGVTL